MTDDITSDADLQDGQDIKTKDIYYEIITYDN